MNELILTTMTRTELQCLLIDCVKAVMKDYQPELNRPDRGGINLAEEVTGYTRSTIYKMTCEGKIPFRQQVPGGKLEFSRKELEEWIEAGRPDVSAQRTATATANYMIGNKKSRSASAKRLNVKH